MKNRKAKSVVGLLFSMAILSLLSTHNLQSAEPTKEPTNQKDRPAVVLVGSVNAAPNYKDRPAVIFQGSLMAPMYGGTTAGQRIVLVGKHGVVLLSDDQGKTFRQAKEVPLRTALYSVFFVNNTEGWAVGELGVVLHTQDGGETWTKLRIDLTSDKPLFSVWFKDGKQGFACGLWGLFLKTIDGGKTWEKVELPPSSTFGWACDSNLYDFFTSKKGSYFLVSEKGNIYKSQDGGQSWREIVTGNVGTFWAGIELKSGTLLVAGVYGRMMRSEDDGENWTPVKTATKSSITDVVQMSDGRIIAVGLDGLMLQSSDNASSFKVQVRPDRICMNGIVLTSSQDAPPVMLTDAGPLVERVCY